MAEGAPDDVVWLKEGAGGAAVGPWEGGGGGVAVRNDLDFPMSKLREEIVDSFQSFVCEISKLEKKSDRWVYRGQAMGWSLETTLSRALGKWDVPREDSLLVERNIIRDFRRGYLGPDVALVRDDTCYCLALMQHHGAATRLLDWTYSPYVAAKFALDCREGKDGPKKRRDGVVWCLNTDWLHNEAANIVGPRMLARWNTLRDEGSFRHLFMPAASEKRFVYTANPVSLNERLRVQQGLFSYLCL